MLQLSCYERVSVQNLWFRSNGGQLKKKFQEEGVASHQPFFLSEN